MPPPSLPAAAPQKVVEGERVQRSEVQRKLRDVEKGLAAIRQPDWWGSAVALIRCGAVLPTCCGAGLQVGMPALHQAEQGAGPHPLLHALPPVQPQQRQRGEAASAQGGAAAAERGAQQAV